MTRNGMAGISVEKDFQKERKTVISILIGKSSLPIDSTLTYRKKKKERRKAEMLAEAMKIENATITSIKYSDRNKTFVAWGVP